jgi:PAS domain S-box-containing protein
MNSKSLTGKVRKAGGKAKDKKPLMRQSKHEGLSQFDDSTKSLLLELGDLNIRPDEAEKILRSIRSGQVNSIVVSTVEGELVYTLKGANYPYLTIVENINEGVVTLLPDGTIVYANKCFADMLGLALEKIMGSFFHYFVHESGKNDFLRLLRDSLAEKQKGEFLLCTAWDRYLPVAVSISPLPIKKQISVSMVITDLTEQKNREDRLDFEVRKRTAELENIIVELMAQNLELRSIQQQLEDDQRALEEGTAKLEEMNKELESFSYSVSHDLRAHLRAIDGYSHMILKKHGNKFDEDTVRKLNEIRLNTQMMGRLIDDLLAFSRLGRKEITKSQLDMSNIIQEVWKELLL